MRQGVCNFAMMVGSRKYQRNGSEKASWRKSSPPTGSSSVTFDGSRFTRQRSSRRDDANYVTGPSRVAIRTEPDTRLTVSSRSASPETLKPALHASCHVAA